MGYRIVRGQKSNHVSHSYLLSIALGTSTYMQTHLKKLYQDYAFEYATIVIKARLKGKIAFEYVTIVAKARLKGKIAFEYAVLAKKARLEGKIAFGYPVLAKKAQLEGKPPRALLTSRVSTMKRRTERPAEKR
ncbi:hypothetical protein GCM10010912_38080 [Paenibacillus albidus]|uniref:Uncharacterized protein n=1 Tax=Paenibacillus albidus TaxID=2041023 RepID=A0A917FM77_9BACL|nr:hypothetical protein [Paenibacillus albidus]GGF89340.1 hypothetical protein GCM10010912_38080 [Paenibacillus albidus]